MMKKKLRVTANLCYYSHCAGILAGLCAKDLCSPRVKFDSQSTHGAASFSFDAWDASMTDVIA